jgi:hypothetical protein
LSCQEFLSQQFQRHRMEQCNRFVTLALCPQA